MPKSYPKKRRRTEVAASINWEPSAIGRDNFDLKTDLGLYCGAIQRPHSEYARTRSTDGRGADRHLAVLRHELFSGNGAVVKMDKNDFSKQVQSAGAQLQEWWKNTGSEKVQSSLTQLQEWSKKNRKLAWCSGALIVCVLGYMLFFSSGRTPDLSAEPLISFYKINTPNRWERSPAYVPLVKIVAKDNVTIHQVILNRGNCQAPWNEQAAPVKLSIQDPGTFILNNQIVAKRQSEEDTLKDRLREMWLGMVGIQLPKSLKFGETLQLPLIAGVCDVLEAEVKTDKGDWTFTWK